MKNVRDFFSRVITHHSSCARVKLINDVCECVRRGYEEERECYLKTGVKTHLLCRSMS